jgi:large subunit ribosomal protein L21
MYAIIKAGGHQYRVKEGDVLTVDKIAGDIGQAINFNEVLMIGGTEGADTVGAPLVKQASVSAVIKNQTKNPKIIILKYKRRKNFKKKMGHKQPVTVVEINKIHK